MTFEISASFVDDQNVPAKAAHTEDYAALAHQLARRVFQGPENPAISMISWQIAVSSTS